jgi:hypothetical protein
MILLEGIAVKDRDRHEKWVEVYVWEVRLFGEGQRHGGLLGAGHCINVPAQIWNNLCVRLSSCTARGQLQK